MANSKEPRKIVGRLICGENDNCVYDNYGTAFLIAPDIVITAGHCVKNYNEDQSIPIIVEFEHLSPEKFQINAKLLSSFDDSLFDIVILKLDKPVENIEFFSLYSGQINDKDSWETFGYPAGYRTSGANFSGNVSMSDAKSYHPWDVALQVEPSFTDVKNYAGLSGSPVLISGQIQAVILDVLDGRISAISVDKFKALLNEYGIHPLESSQTVSDLSSEIIALREDRDFDDEERKELSEGFGQGISAQYEHILADLDVKRHQKMKDIAQKFEEKRVVIIHGASGQGKTTLAYRYLHDHVRQMPRFKIECVQDRRHVFELASKIVDYAKTLGAPIFVYFDVSAQENDWIDLAKQLSLHRNIFFLITIREEDFKRANISGAEIQFSDIELTFHKAEAQEIYQAITAKHISAEFLSFDDAWNKFGGEGPLMEFVYLVVHSDTLRERLQQQIQRLENEVVSKKLPPEVLELLRLVSVASTYEARLKVMPLVKYLNLPAPKAIFKTLEKEYFLRISPDGHLVKGLHSIRSAILSDILNDPAFSPWSEDARICFPFLHESDLEIFLLYAFSRHSKAIKPLLETLQSFQPESWQGIAGIKRALLWLGISEYVKSNQNLIREIYEYSGTGWWTILDFDIADAVPGSGQAFHKAFENKISPEWKELIHAFQARQTDKRIVFQPLKEWLATRAQQPTAPTTAHDWAGMTEVAFWIGRLEVACPLADWVNETELDTAVNTLPLDILADLVFGLSLGYGNKFGAWLAKNRSMLIVRFRQETNTIVFEDDGKKLTIHFVLPFERQENGYAADEGVQEEKDLFHEETLYRLRILRKLLPDRQLYASQGYGHRVWNKSMPIDSTTKTGIASSNFPPLWLISINSIFRGLANKQFRLQDWAAYANAVVDFRKIILTKIFKELEHGLEVYLRKQKSMQLLGETINTEEWESHKRLMAKTPMLPICAVDEWGFVNEFQSRSDSHDDESTSLIAEKKKIHPLSIALQKYSPLVRTFDKYTFALSNFLSQSVDVMAINPHLKKSSIEKAKALEVASQHGLRDFAHRSTVNLGDAAEGLFKFQSEFRKLLGHFFDERTLQSLEAQERDMLNGVWSLWYAFAFNPQRILQQPRQECFASIHKAFNEIRKALRKELKAVSTDEIEVKIHSEEIAWDDRSGLWLTIDGKHLLDVYAFVENVVRVTRRAIHKIEKPALRNHLIEMNWPFIAIVPLVRGKSLDVNAWHINTLILSVGDKEDELNWWNFLTQPIRQESFTELKIALWDVPRLEVGRKLWQSIVVLSMLTAHVRDITNLPETDEQGENLLQQYFEQLGVHISSGYQAVLDSVVEMADYITEIKNKEEHPNLINIMEISSSLKNIIFPKSEIENGLSMTLDEMSAWAEKLEEGRNLAFIVYSSWVSDVLDEINT